MIGNNLKIIKGLFIPQCAIYLKLHLTITPYYSLFDKSEGINSGLKYKQAKKTMLSDIANQRENRSVDIYNKPEIDSGKHRVTGPFTVEALPCVQVKSFNDDQNQIFNNIFA